jgi:hypothetical protein
MDYYVLFIDSTDIRDSQNLTIVCLLSSFFLREIYSYCSAINSWVNFYWYDFIYWLIVWRRCSLLKRKLIYSISNQSVSACACVLSSSALISTSNLPIIVTSSTTTTSSSILHHFHVNPPQMRERERHRWQKEKRHCPSRTNHSSSQVFFKTYIHRRDMYV